MYGGMITLVIYCDLVMTVVFSYKHNTLILL